MTERSTASEIYFSHAFALSALKQPLSAGTYRLYVEEELIEGLSFSAFRRVSTRLEIPAISVKTSIRQSIQVDYEELEAALAKDAEARQ